MQNLAALCKSLNNLCNFLDKEYDVNNGGCCYLAYLLAAQLEKLQLKYKFIIYDIEDKDIEAIQHEVSNKSKNRRRDSSVTGANSCNHYCLYLENGGEVNKSSFNDANEFRYVLENISSSNIRWIYRTGEWNEDYDPSNNTVIKDMIKSFFKHYRQKYEKEN